MPHHAGQAPDGHPPAMLHLQVRLVTQRFSLRHCAVNPTRRNTETCRSGCKLCCRDALLIQRRTANKHARKIMHLKLLGNAHLCVMQGVLSAPGLCCLLPVLGSPVNNMSCT
jgi:hypothetical protein